MNSRRCRPPAALQRLADGICLECGKKLKDKNFAAAVSRDDIRAGAEEIGAELNQHIAFVIEALSPIAAELGLPTSEG